MPSFSLIPKKNIFFTQFSQHAQNSLEAAQALEKLLSDFTDVEVKVRDIHAIEHYGDKLTHEIMRELNETFVTPLDREDIAGLASKIDDVADVCHDVAELLLMYTIKNVRPGAIRQAKTLTAAAAEMSTMISNLQSLKNLDSHFIKMHTFENEGDQIFREAVAELFKTEHDAIEIIKWKDLHSLIEVALDRCEDVANIVETIKIKHS